jgi:predicted RNA-binding protein with RPS1 domain
MTQGYLSDPTSIIKIGDKLKIKIAGFNDNHQIKLSSPEFKASHPGSPRPEGQSERPSFDRNRSSGGFRNFSSGSRGPRR